MAKSKRAATKQVTAAPAAPTGPAKALTTRALDFWLLGGLSIVVWAVMFSLDRAQQQGAMVQRVFAVSAVLALVVTSPHFMASYALAYRKGWAFIRAHWFQLLAVPAVLLALMAAAWLYRDVPSRESSVIASLNGFFQSAGLRTRFGMTPTLATELLGLLVNFMFLTVGWHYTKQVYGSMMVYAAFDGLRVDAGQRRVLKVNLFLLWWLTFAWANSNVDAQVFFGLTYFHLGLPPVIFIVSFGLLLISLLVVAVRVFWPLYKQRGKWPGWNFVVPYVAMYVWWFPGFQQEAFYLYLVPVFHSAQYLAFVFKLEKVRNADVHAGRFWQWSALMVVGLLVASYLSFDLIPNSVDAATQSRSLVGVGVFLVCAQVFINVHHYFIDNVLWRFDNPELKKYLLA